MAETQEHLPARRAPIHRARPAGPDAEGRTLPVATVVRGTQALDRPAPAPIFHIATRGDKMAIWSGALAVFTPMTLVGQVVGIVLAAQALRNRNGDGAIGWKRWAAWGALLLHGGMLLVTIVVLVAFPIIIYKS